MTVQCTIGLVKMSQQEARSFVIPFVPHLMEILHGVVPADEEDPGDLVDARVAVDAHGRDQPRVSLPLRHGGRRR